MWQYKICFHYFLNGSRIDEADTAFAINPKKAINEIEKRYFFHNIEVDSVHEANGFCWGYVDPIWWKE